MDAEEEDNEELEERFGREIQVHGREFIFFVIPLLAPQTILHLFCSKRVELKEEKKVRWSRSTIRPCIGKTEGRHLLENLCVCACTRCERFFVVVLAGYGSNLRSTIPVDCRGGVWGHTELKNLLL